MPRTDQALAGTAGKNAGSALVVGAGQIGTAVAARLLDTGISSLALHSRSARGLARCVASLSEHAATAGVKLLGSHGDLALPGELVLDGSPLPTGPAPDTRTGPGLADVARRRLAGLLARRGADVVVDSTNLATVLADPQPVLAGSADGGPDRAEDLWTAAVCHIAGASAVAVHEALAAGQLGSYLRVSTTGLGGLGLDIPFTHGDAGASRLSPALWRKLQVSGIQHQLLWAAGRSFPGRVHLVVPSASVGFEDVAADRDEPTALVGAGEGRRYALQELLLMANPSLMGVVSKEEVAEAVLRTLAGDPTFDLLAAMTTASLTPTARGQRELDRVVAALRAAEQHLDVPSVAVGSLGPAVAARLVELYALKTAFAVTPVRDLPHLDEDGALRAWRSVTVVRAMTKAGGLALLDRDGAETPPPPCSVSSPRVELTGPRWAWWTRQFADLLDRDRDGDGDGGPGTGQHPALDPAASLRQLDESEWLARVFTAQGRGRPAT